MDELRFIPINTEDSDPGVFVQGTHVPARLVEESGVWIREAGSAILTQDQYQIAPFHHTLWLIADEGNMTMTFGAQRLRFKKGECFVIPAGTTDCRLEEARDSRLLWFTVDGALATAFLPADERLQSGSRPAGHPAQSGFADSADRAGAGASQRHRSGQLPAGAAALGAAGGAQRPQRGDQRGAEP